MKPNYDQEKSIYVPYNMLKDKLANKSVELGNVPVIKMIVELNSLDDYHDISKNLSDYYIFTTSLDISSQSQFIQVFGSIYLVFIWIFMIIILSIYKIYRIIGDKRNIALLQTLGFGPFLNVIARHERVKGVQRQRERALRQVMVSGVGHRGRHVVSGGIRHHRRRGVDGQRILLPVLGEGRMRGNV